MADDPIQSSHTFPVRSLASRNLSVLVCGLVVLYALYKAKSEDVPKIVETIFGSHTFAFAGWILAIAILVASAVLIKLLIRNNDREVKRLTDERNDLQRRLLGE